MPPHEMSEEERRFLLPQIEKPTEEEKDQKTEEMLRRIEFLEQKVGYLEEMLLRDY